MQVHISALHASACSPKRGAATFGSGRRREGRRHDRLHRRLGSQQFGKLDNETVESLVVRVANEALDHAGIGAEEVDEILLGHFNAGFTPQDFTASIVLQANDKFRFKPATRVENACATGSAAVHQAIKAIEARRARVALVVGVEQMTHAPSPDIARNLLKASYLAEDGETPGGFAGVFGKIAGAYFQRHGDQSDALAMIAAKNHKNGVVESLRADAQGPRLRVLPRRVGEEPLRGRAAQAHGLLARLGRRRGARRSPTPRPRCR